MLPISNSITDSFALSLTDKFFTNGKSSDRNTMDGKNAV
jgi:hypothetical protein